MLYSIVILVLLVLIQQVKDISFIAYTTTSDANMNINIKGGIAAGIDEGKNAIDEGKTAIAAGIDKGKNAIASKFSM